MIARAGWLAAVLLIPLAVRGPQSVPMPVTGDYLAEEFMEGLQETRSVADALSRSPGPVRARVAASKDGHEVSRGDLATDCGAALLRTDGSTDPAADTGDPAVHVVSNARFTTTLCAAAGTFVHVGDHRHWISNVILGGRYKDPRGAKFVFGSQGQATFGGRRHEWTIPLDAPADRIEMDGVRYAWLLERGLLKIFPLSERGEPAAEPLWTLRRMVTDS